MGGGGVRWRLASVVLLAWRLAPTIGLATPTRAVHARWVAVVVGAQRDVA